MYKILPRSDSVGAGRTSPPPRLPRLEPQDGGIFPSRQTRRVLPNNLSHYSGHIVISRNIK